MPILTEDQEALIRNSIAQAVETAIKQVPLIAQDKEREVVTGILYDALGFSYPSSKAP
jgi:hypothetical protein